MLAACWSTRALCPAGSTPSPPSPCNTELKLNLKKKWRENAESTRASAEAREMAGKYETVCLVDHQKQNKWRENSTARATTEVKEKGRKIRNYMDQL